MKKFILFILSICIVMNIVSCGKETSTHVGKHTFYKENIKWGMSIDEVKEQLGSFVKEYTGTYIVARDDEDEIICAYDLSYDGADVRYNFTNSGKLYEIEFEVDGSWIDYSVFCDIVGLYQRDYTGLKIDEVEIFNERTGSERAGSFCDLDEYTRFSVIYVSSPFDGKPRGTISVSYKNYDLERENGDE